VLSKNDQVVHANYRVGGAMYWAVLLDLPDTL
jgi:hypothetical protein